MNSCQHRNTHLIDKEPLENSVSTDRKATRELQHKYSYLLIHTPIQCLLEDPSLPATLPFERVMYETKITTGRDFANSFSDRTRHFVTPMSRLK